MLIWEYAFADIASNIFQIVRMDIEELSDDKLIFSGAPEQKTENGILKHYVKYTYKRIWQIADTDKND